MNEKSSDMALEALLSAASRFAPDLNIEVLKSAYAIEYMYQFDLARDQPHKSLQKLVDDLVAIGQTT